MGTFFITTSWIDAPTWLTQANLHSIAADGNEVGGHTVTHPDLTTLSTADATAEVCDGRTTLAAWGFNATDFAYPFAAQNAATQQIVKDCGFASARSLGDIRLLPAAPIVLLPRPFPRPIPMKRRRRMRSTAPGRCRTCRTWSPTRRPAAADGFSSPSTTSPSARTPR